MPATALPAPAAPLLAGVAGEPPFDLDGAWGLHPQVALRPEAFGALAYHFGTRRLSFLKSPALHALVDSLADHETARAACAAAGIPDAQLPTYQRALATLVASDMLVPREPA